MIRDADLWKDDLVATREALAKIARQRMHARRTHVAIERALFLGFYAVRKLFLDGHLSPPLAENPVSVTRFSFRGVDFGRQNQHLLDRWYEMDNPVPATLSLRRICNQFVHSFVFIIQLEQDSTISGFYVVSDDFRKKSLYFVALSDVLRLFYLVGKDRSSHRGHDVNRTTERPGVSLVE